MSTFLGTSKYKIDGENAAKVYDAVVNSYMYKNFPEYITLDYKDGHLLVVEEWIDYPQFGHYVLPFLIGNDFACEDVVEDDE